MTTRLDDLVFLICNPNNQPHQYVGDFEQCKADIMLVATEALKEMKNG